MPALRAVAVVLLSLATGAAADDLSGKDLVQALRQGGFTLYFRHAQTDWSNPDRVRARGDWNSCDPSRMRQLSDRGRANARAVGAAIRALGVPVDSVVASPYCRTVETARLMDLGPVTTSDDVMNLRVADYFGGRGAIVATARRRLAISPPAGSNAVIVAHGNVAREATPVYPGEAEGVVFLADGDGGFSPVARLNPEQWKALAETHASSGH